MLPNTEAELMQLLLVKGTFITILIDMEFLTHDMLLDWMTANLEWIMPNARIMKIDSKQIVVDVYGVEIMLTPADNVLFYKIKEFLARIS